MGSAPVDLPPLTAGVSAAEVAQRWVGTLSSPNTRAAYAADVAAFGAWCAASGIDPLHARHADLAEHHAHHVASGASEASVARRRSALSGFYRFAVNSGAALRDPIDRAVPVVAPASSTAALAPTQRRALIRTAARRHEAADVVVLILLLDGLQLHEILAADVADLSFRPKSAVVNLVGRGTTAPLCSTTARATKSYVGSRHSGPLLLGRYGAGDHDGHRHGRRLTRAGASYMLVEVGREHGVPGPLTANMLRRTYAAHAHADGMNVDAIRRQMGHTDERTTRRYLPAEDLGAAGSRRRSHQPTP